jgi:hypothetical protein
MLQTVDWWMYKNSNKEFIQETDLEAVASDPAGEEGGSRRLWSRRWGWRIQSRRWGERWRSNGLSHRGDGRSPVRRRRGCRRSVGGVRSGCGGWIGRLWGPRWMTAAGRTSVSWLVDGGSDGVARRARTRTQRRWAEKLSRRHGVYFLFR